MSEINGAEILLQTLVDAEVEVCFTNPGTSEMHFVAALDRVPKMRAILGLFEGVVTGAADGYARMAEKPAATLLHLGPGLANGLANLHNARKAKTPVVNIVGEHATYHRQYDAPLTSDLEGFARPVSGTIIVSESADDLAKDAVATVAAARQTPGQVATLVLPADTAWNIPKPAAAPTLALTTPTIDTLAIEQVAQLLNGQTTEQNQKVALLVASDALRAEGLEAVGRIRKKTGCRAFCNTFNARVQRGAGLVEIERLPYFGEQIEEKLQGIEHIILVGSGSPVSFFAYPGKNSWLTPEQCATRVLATPEHDLIASLLSLAEAVDAPEQADNYAQLKRPEQLATGKLDGMAIAVALATFMPENAIVSDEGNTAGGLCYPLTANAPAHDWMFLTGGAIGQGMPLATGAAVACPDRKVISLQADGSAMYTIQSLWTQARENLDVLTIIFNNRAYGILNVELMRVGAQNPGRGALDLFDLSRPNIDFVQLAQGMGVSAVSVDTAEGFNQALEAALKQTGPRLIEAILV